eukprot:609030-Prorocentrum_minimum.AAC.1
MGATVCARAQRNGKQLGLCMEVRRLQSAKGRGLLQVRMLSPLKIWGVECILAVIGTGGPVK